MGLSTFICVRLSIPLSENLMNVVFFDPLVVSLVHSEMFVGYSDNRPSVNIFVSNL